MSDIALRPRSPTELVDAAFQLYRREPLQFITGLALVYVPWLAVAALIGAGVGAREAVNTVTANPMDELARSLVNLVIAMGGVLVTAISGGVVSVMANEVYFGRPADIGAAFRTVMNRLGSLLLALLGFGVMLVFGMLLLLFPGLYVYARYFGLKQVILFEKADVGDAFARCSVLTVDLKWHVLNTMGLVFLLNLAISVGAGMATHLISSRIVQVVASACVSVVIYPLIGITETLLYYDLRIRREGFDIEYLAAAAPPSSPTESPATT